MRAGRKKSDAQCRKNGKRVVFQAVYGQGHSPEGMATGIETQAEGRFGRDFRRFVEEAWALLHGQWPGLRSYAPTASFGLMFQSLYLRDFSGNFDP